MRNSLTGLPSRPGLSFGVRMCRRLTPSCGASMDGFSAAMASTRVFSQALTFQARSSAAAGSSLPPTTLIAGLRNTARGEPIRQSRGPTLDRRARLLRRTQPKTVLTVVVDVHLGGNVMRLQFQIKLDGRHDVGR